MPKCRHAGESLPKGDPAGKRYCQKPFLLNATFLAPKLPEGCSAWRSSRTLPYPNRGQLEEDVLLEATMPESGHDGRRFWYKVSLQENVYTGSRTTEGWAGRTELPVGCVPEANPAVGRTCRRAALSEGGLSEGSFCHFPALPDDTGQAHL